MAVLVLLQQSQVPLLREPEVAAVEVAILAALLVELLPEVAAMEAAVAVQAELLVLLTQAVVVGVEVVIILEPQAAPVS
jgi:hypothetical protein